MTTTPLELLAQAKANLDTHIDTHTLRVTKTWAAAWDDLSAQLEAEFRRIIALGRSADGLDAERAHQIHDTLSGIVEQRMLDLAAAIDKPTAAALHQITSVTLADMTAVINTQIPPRYRNSPVRPVPAAALAGIVARAQQQITVRNYMLQQQATRAMKRELVAAIGAGDNPKEAARRMLARVEGEFNGGLTRATVIARTEMLDAARDAALQQRITNRHILAYWVWHAALTERTCPACWSMHGSRHPIDEPGPIDHHQGRCIALPVTKEAAATNDPGLVPPEDAGRRAFEALPAAQQERILGSGRYTAWREGRYPTTMWAERREHYTALNGTLTRSWRDSIHIAPIPPAHKNITAPRRLDNIMSGAGLRLDPPPEDRKLTPEEASHFALRQAQIPHRYSGQTLKPREVLFAERMHFVRGERLTWIPIPPATTLPDGKRHTPSSNDFTWRGIQYELKSKKPNYRSISRELKGTVNTSKTNAHTAPGGVIKDRFIIDLGRYPLSPKLRSQLELYNTRVDSGHIKELWVMSGDGTHLERIRLKPH